MKPVYFLLSVVLVLAFGLSVPALAGTNPASCVSFHVVPGSIPDPCVTLPSFADNCSIIPEATPNPGDILTVYVLVCNANDNPGVSGIEFGLSYDPTANSGIDILGFESCADVVLESPSFPDSGSGAMLVWDASTNCQTTGFLFNEVYSVAGAFEVQYFTPDQLAVFPFPGTYGSVRVADCNLASDDLIPSNPSRLGVAGFNMTGFNACQRAGIAYSTFSTVVPVSPNGNAAYVMTIMDCAGFFRQANVEIEINPAAPICLCTGTSPPFQTVANSQGVATLNIAGGGCITKARLGTWPARLIVDGAYWGDLDIVSPDPVDHAGRLPTDPGYALGPPCRSNTFDFMWFAPIIGGTVPYDRCADFDDDGSISAADWTLIQQIVGMRAKCP